MEPPLNAWAKGRRHDVGPAFELHPADRTRLQEEAARTYAHTPSRHAAHPSFSWRQLWPRLAFVGGVAGLLLLAVLQLGPNRDSSTMELARVDDLRREPAPRAPAPDQGPAKTEFEPAPTIAFQSDSPQDAAPPLPQDNATGLTRSDTSEPAARLMMERYGLSPTGPAPQPSPPSPRASIDASPVTQTAAPLAAEEATRRLRVTGAVSEPKSAVRSAYPAPPLQQADSAPELAQSFAPRQQLRQNFNAPPAVALQSSFLLEQRGQQLRVIDHDGSVYDGSILPAQSPAATAGLSPVVGLPFEVAGTNLSQQVSVLFRGTLGTSMPARVQGHAILGNRDRVVVDAVLTEP